MDNSNNWWTLTRSPAYTYGIFYVYNNGSIDIGSAIDTNCATYPTLYLSSEIKITGGTGTQSDPYTIE